MAEWIIKIVVTACCAFVLAIFSKYWDPIAAHIGYPFSVGINLAELGGKVETLSNKQSDFRSWDSNRFPSEESKGWLSRVDDLQKEEKELNKRYAKCSILSYLSLCHIGKDVETELKKANELINQGDKLLANAKPLPRTFRDVQPEDQPVPGRFPGMEGAYNKVLNFIKDDPSAESVTMGIWGMGGVGKTTLIERVRNARLDQYATCFEVVLFVRAGKSGSTVSHLQKVISTDMGLDQMNVETSQEGFIHNHLHDKNFLLLVDDLCRPINLEEVGIPSLQPQIHRYQRKVVFTTRSEEVCSNMNRNSKYTIKMKCLNRKDAWDLFAQNVDKSILECEEIRQLAEKIVGECSGLPMALCTIGKSMSCKQDYAEWTTAEQELKMSLFNPICRNQEDLFKCLKESYDNLLDDKEKERFLLCSLWPENKNISIKKLTRWWTGHGLLPRFSNASDLGYSIINVLVRSSLLEKGDTGFDSTENSHVKMHSMIRKMAIRIVNEHSYKWLPNSLHNHALEQEEWITVEKAWVSEKDTSIWHQWTSETVFPELKMLVAQHVFSFELIRPFHNITFLDLEGVTLFISRKGETPASHTTSPEPKQKKKRSKRQTRIKKNQSDKCPLEIICKLVELRHLNLSATSLGSLSLVLKELSKLKYLYIRNNMDLQTIPRGIILALNRLRGLDLFCTGASFPDVLDELASSTITLEMLGFTVQTAAEITKLGQLERVCTQALCMHHFEEDQRPATINLEFLSNLEQLRELTINMSSHIVKLLVPGGDTEHDQPLFPCLQFIELNSLRKLEKVIWVNAGMNIRVVNISKCDKLKDVTWVHRLKCLEQLIVAHCQEMERLIETGELSQGASVDQIAAISFRRLKKLQLEELPMLSMISEQACVFDDLSYISVTQCNEMKGIHEQKYKKVIKIRCCEDWWTNNTSEKPNDNLVPTFFS